MTRLITSALLLAALLVLPTSAETAPTVGPLTANPGLLMVQESAPVTLTTTITDPTYLAGSANIQRLINGTWTIVGSLQPTGGGTFSFTQTFTEPAVGEVRLRASAAFRGVLQRALSPEIALPVCQRIPPAAGATVNGLGGIRLIVAPGTSSSEIVACLAPVALTTLPASPRPITAAVNLTLLVSGSLLLHPVQLSVPAPAGTPNGAQFIVAQKILVDSVSGTTGGLREALQPVEIATAAGGQLVTPATASTNDYPGILSGGIFAFIRSTFQAPP